MELQLYVHVILAVLLIFTGVCYCQVNVDVLKKSLEYASGVNDLPASAVENLRRLGLEKFHESLLDRDDGCGSQFLELYNYTYEEKIIGGSSVSYRAIDIAVDAFGKPGSGILRGATNFKGSFDECLSIKTNFTMQYCLSHLVLGVGTQFTLPFYEALCIPATCNKTVVDAALNETTKILYEAFRAYLVLDRTSEAGFMCTSQEKVPFTPGAKAMIFISSLMVALVVIGTIVDLYTQIYQLIVKNERVYGNVINDGSTRLIANEVNEKATLLQQHVHSDQPKGPVSQKLSGFLYDLIVSFSLYKTVPAIISTHQPASAISCINGMRVISMFWVILGHIYIFSLTASVLDNTSDLFSFAKRFSAQPILNGFLSVDTFFVLSGLLVSYLTLREMNRKKGRFPFLSYYLHRFLRLTPTYMFVMFFIWGLFEYMGNGPTFKYSAQALASSCKKYWWTNLLYINNFVPSNFNDECIGWVWYLANDMQFFVISPLLLIPLYYFLPAGLIAVLVLLLASFGVTGFIAGYYGFPANEFGGLFYGTDIRPPDFPDQSSEIYGKPYCRISPYLVGIVLGYIFFKNYHFKLHYIVNWVIHLVLWALAIVFGMSTVYGLYSSFNGHHVTGTENVMYYMFSRFTWGLALALLAFSCHNGYGGVINHFLSLPFWVPLGRLTFNAYLVHPVVIFGLYTSLRNNLHFDTNTMVVYTIASCVLSYGIAGVISVFVEFPLSNVEMSVFKLFGVKRGESKNVKENIKVHQNS